MPGCSPREPVTVDGAEVVPRWLFHTLIEPRIRAPRGARDVVLNRLRATGLKDGRETALTLDVFVYPDEALDLTAMQKATGWHAAIVCHLMADGQIAPGATPVEVASIPRDSWRPSAHAASTSRNGPRRCREPVRRRLRRADRAVHDVVMATQPPSDRVRVAPQPSPRRLRHPDRVRHPRRGLRLPPVRARPVPTPRSVRTSRCRRRSAPGCRAPSGTDRGDDSQARGGPAARRPSAAVPRSASSSIRRRRPRCCDSGSPRSVGTPSEAPRPSSWVSCPLPSACSSCRTAPRGCWAHGSRTPACSLPEDRRRHRPWPHRRTDHEMGRRRGGPATRRRS